MERNREYELYRDRAAAPMRSGARVFRAAGPLAPARHFEILDRADRSSAAKPIAAG